MEISRLRTHILITTLLLTACGGGSDGSGDSITYYQDADGDDYGNSAVSQESTSQPVGYVLDNTDCDDAASAVNPGATEVADGIDNNCDGQIDEGFTTYYQDADGDDYGNSAVSQESTTQPAGYVLDNTDCDDTAGAVNPGATEVADGIDNDCDGQIDNVFYIIPLNDTGITWGGNQPSGNNATCIGETITQQDCSFGRDATHDDDSDGFAGFSYTKLDANGDDLPASATDWTCVRDNVTRLIWEVKQGGNTVTGDEGLHDADDTYNWYNTDTNTNGGTVGIADNDGDVCYGYNVSDPDSFCNTEAYVARVNATSFCGATNWRMPDRMELYGLVNRDKAGGSSPLPAIDEVYFPNTRIYLYWSSTPYPVGAGDSAIYVSFTNGSANTAGRQNPWSVRLVRDIP